MLNIVYLSDSVLHLKKDEKCPQQGERNIKVISPKIQWRPSEQFPGDEPKLDRMSTHRPGSGSDSVTVTRTSLSWTQKVLEPQIAVEEKSM